MELRSQERESWDRLCIKMKKTCKANLLFGSGFAKPLLGRRFVQNQMVKHLQNPSFVQKKGTFAQLFHALAYIRYNVTLSSRRQASIKKLWQCTTVLDEMRHLQGFCQTFLDEDEDYEVNLNKYPLRG